MQRPLRIHFHGVDHSPAVEERVREAAEKLETFHERITSCRVTIDASHRSQEKGTLYKVTVDLVIPGAELVVSSCPGDEREHEDVYVAIRDAFDTTRRRLQNFVERHRER